MEPLVQEEIPPAPINYNPFKDANFWLALFIGGAPILIILVGQGLKSLPFVAVMATFLVVWEAWVIFKKGASWSFVVGLVLALIAAGAVSYGVAQLELRKLGEGLPSFEQWVNQAKLDESVKEGFKDANATFAGPTIDGEPFCYDFNSDLTIGNSGSDVHALNIVLGIEVGAIIGPTLTDTFDEDTAAEVVKFQAKHGIKQTGYVSPMTRAKLSSLYGCSNQVISPVASTQPSSVTVTYPNGGETVRYGDIYMAGDLYFRWTTSQKEKYVPTPNKKAYIIDSNGNIVRDDPVWLSITNLGNGVFGTSFPGEKNIEVNGKYRIKVCDSLDSKEYCDLSDNYFTIVQ